MEPDELELTPRLSTISTESRLLVSAVFQLRAALDSTKYNSMQVKDSCKAVLYRRQKGVVKVKNREIGGYHGTKSVFDVISDLV